MLGESFVKRRAKAPRRVAGSIQLVHGHPGFTLLAEADR